MSKLDQQFFDLADTHNLDHIALQLFTVGDGTRFLGVNVIAHKIVGASHGRGESLDECFKEALADLRAKQGATAVEFAPMGQAA